MNEPDFSDAPSAQTAPEKPAPKLYRVPDAYVGPHGCDVCGHATMGPEPFDPTIPCPECGTVYRTDLGRLIKKQIDAMPHGTQAAIAREVPIAPETLARFLSGSREQIPLRAIEIVLDALGAKIVFDAV